MDYAVVGLHGRGSEVLLSVGSTVWLCGLGNAGLVLLAREKIVEPNTYMCKDIRAVHV